MATVVNFIDTTLQAAATRTVALPTSRIKLDASEPLFKVAADGTITPASITFTATFTDLDPVPLTFNVTGGKLTSVAAAVATLVGTDMTGTSATVIASATIDGTVYTAPCTITKFQDGATGPAGERTLTVQLQKWSATAPAKPTGTSTLTWSSMTNSAYTGSDGWAVSAENPGTPGLKLYIATVAVSAAASATTTTVSYTNATVAAWSQNGATGASGVQTRPVTVYQWAATIPAGPTGSGSLKWSDGTFGAAPTGWALTPGAAPTAGMTLWAGTVQVTDTATASTTAFQWSTAAIMAVGYAGSNGQQGASYVTAYCATTVGTGTSAPAPTKGKGSLPAANSGGLTGSYSASVPTLSAGQYQMQTDGIYDPTTDYITWSIPYQSSLKVATLSAITANLGAINAGSINLGNGVFTVDNDGNLVCMSITVKRKSDGKVILTTEGLTVDGVPAEALNSNVVVGGRNLYPDSSFERGQHTLLPQTRLTTVQTSNISGVTGGTKALYMDGSATDMYLYLGTRMAVTPGVTYTIAFDYKCATNGTITGSSSYFRTFDASGTQLVHNIMAFDPAADQVWRRFSMQWTCPAGTYYIEPRFGLKTNGVFSWLTVDNIKIEEGNKATAWTPALEDTAADVAAAQAAANTANTAIAAMSSDNVLSMGEKPAANIEWTAIYNERAPLIAQAAAVGVDSTDYAAKYKTLGDYLVALSTFSNYAVDTVIDGAAFRNGFANYYIAKQALLNAIAAKIQGNAAAAQNTALLGLADFANYKVWDFTGTDEGFSRQNARIDVYSSVVQVVATAADPYIMSPTIAIPGGLYDKIRIRLRRIAGTGWDGTIFYSTAGHSYSGSYIKTIPDTIAANTAGGYAVLEWDMAALTAGGNDWATNTITSIRIDLGSTAADIFEIDYIVIGKYGKGSSVLDINDKISQAAGGILRAPITLTTGGGVVVGTLTYDPNTGLRTGGSGVAITPFGMLCHNGVGYAFTMGADGKATYAGELAAAGGSFGNVTVAAGGSLSIGQSGYDTGTGLWFGWSNGVPKLSIGTAGGSALLWDGTTLTIRNPSMDAFTAYLSGSAGGSYANGSQGYGTLTVNTSGGKAPYRYQWVLSLIQKSGSAGNMVMNSATSQSASFSGSGTNASLDYAVSVVVTDANGRSYTLSTEIVANHGVPP